MLLQKAFPQQILKNAGSGFFSTFASLKPENQWFTVNNEKSLLTNDILSKVVLFREVKLKSATIRNSYRLYPESPEIQVGMIRKDPKTSAYKITLLLLPQNDAVKPIYIGNSVLQIRQPTVAELTKILKEAKKIFATEMDCYEMYDRIDEDWKKAIADHSKLLEDLRKVKKRKNAQPFIFFSGNGYPHDLIAKLERQLSEFAENNPKSPQFKR